jgi:hypothetical protein
MSAPGGSERLATLWSLHWNGDRVSCIVYRTGGEMLLRVESDQAVMITERFALQPRMLARAQALRDALKRRGWEEVSS